jgi:hypothetical protein
LHKNVADYEDIVEGGDGIKSTVSAEFRAQIRSRRVEILFSVVDAESQEDRKEQERSPDGEGDENCVDEAGSRDGRGDVGVGTLCLPVSSSDHDFREKQLTKPSTRLEQSFTIFATNRGTGDANPGPAKGGSLAF